MIIQTKNRASRKSHKSPRKKNGKFSPSKNQQYYYQPSWKDISNEHEEADDDVDDIIDNRTRTRSDTDLTELEKSHALDIPASNFSGPRRSTARSPCRSPGRSPGRSPRSHFMSHDDSEPEDETDPVILSSFSRPINHRTVSLPGVMFSAGINDKIGGLTELHRACIRGDPQMVQKLLGEGADAWLTEDRNKETPLHLALRHSKLEIARYLLQHTQSLRLFGATAFTQTLPQDGHNNSPLHSLLLYNSPHTSNSPNITLSNSGNNITTSPIISQPVGDPALLNEIFTLVLEWARKDKAAINGKNDKGNTPLMIAVLERWQATYVGRLVRAGAEVNVVCGSAASLGPNRDTPLKAAVATGHLPLVEACLSRSPLHSDRSCKSPLHVAAEFGYTAICEFLIKHGADLRAKNSQGQTPLECCSNLVTRKLLEDYDPRSKSWKSMIEISEIEISFSSPPIGEGQFGKCYKGKLHGTPVAIKVLKVPTMSESTIQSFHHEVGVASDIQHPNVVLLLGACVCQQKNYFCIITEYLAQGSLREYLTRLSTDEVSLYLLKRFAVTTARGLAWLHSRKPMVLHRDLHTGNILLGSNLECKVGDFGMSAIQGELQSQSVAWYRRIIPPEIKYGDSAFTDKSDVFAFGLVLYELLFPKRKASQKLVTQLLVDFNNHSLQEPAQVEEIEDSDYYSSFRDYLNVSHRRGILSAMQQCNSFTPKERPSFESLTKLLLTISEVPSARKSKASTPSIIVSPNINNSSSKKKTAEISSKSAPTYSSTDSYTTKEDLKDFVSPPCIRRFADEEEDGSSSGYIMRAEEHSEEFASPQRERTVLFFLRDSGSWSFENDEETVSGDLCETHLLSQR